MALVIAGAHPAQSPAQATRESPLIALTGSYAVGRTRFDWIDSSRADSESPGGRRELVVWVWYPAAALLRAEPAEWMPGKWGDAFWSDFVNGRKEVDQYRAAHPISSIRAHSHDDVHVASGTQRFPVLLFAPGLGTTPLEYASLIEDVVSHGYIVAGIVPTYLARASVFSDGRVAEGREIHAAVGVRGPAPRTAAQAIQEFELAASICSHDMIFALEQLQRMDTAAGNLNARFDFSRVGALGHSLGGAAALQVGNDEPRVRAVFDIDGSPVWSAANGALAKPVLILSAASTPGGYDGPLSGAAPGMHLRVAGTTHNFPSDMRLMPFLSQAAPDPRGPVPVLAGLIDPSRALAITVRYVVAFFDRYLSGTATSLLDGPSRDQPEVTFERANVP